MKKKELEIRLEVLEKQFKEYFSKQLEENKFNVVDNKSIYKRYSDAELLVSQDRVYTDYGKLEYTETDILNSSIFSEKAISLYKEGKLSIQDMFRLRAKNLQNPYYYKLHKIDIGIIQTALKTYINFYDKENNDNSRE